MKTGTVVHCSSALIRRRRVPSCWSRSWVLGHRVPLLVQPGTHARPNVSERARLLLGVRQSVAPARRKISVIRTRPELVSVRNKPSNFSVRSSLRGLQFLVTSLPRRPPRFNRSFFHPLLSLSLSLSLFQFFFRALSHGLTRCAPTLNTGPPAIVTEPESFADRCRAEETLFPLFSSFYSFHPPLPLGLPLPARLLRFPSFQPLFSCSVTSFSPLSLSLFLSPSRRFLRPVVAAREPALSPLRVLSAALPRRLESFPLLFHSVLCSPVSM